MLILDPSKSFKINFVPNGLSLSPLQLQYGNGVTPRPDYKASALTALHDMQFSTHASALDSRFHHSTSTNGVMPNPVKAPPPSLIGPPQTSYALLGTSCGPAPYSVASSMALDSLQHSHQQPSHSLSLKRPCSVLFDDGLGGAGAVDHPLDLRSPKEANRTDDSGGGGGGGGGTGSGSGGGSDTPIELPTAMKEESGDLLGESASCAPSPSTSSSSSKPEFSFLCLPAPPAFRNPHAGVSMALV